MNEQLKIIISAETEKLKQNLAKAKKEIKDFGIKAKETVSKFNEGMQQVADVSKKALKVVGTAIAGTVAALVGVTEATREYRTQQALLASSFITSGSSAEVAKETYNDLFRVLGDSGKATEAAQHLAMLTTEQEALSEWTNICQGVYATFGDSLPIESLTEAANETAKTGELTGALADALNWAGISEEEFKDKLFECNTEAEREALIRETLSGLYSDAASNYESTAKSILEANDAQRRLTDASAKVGEAVEPVVTTFKEFGAELLEKLTPIIQDFVDKHLPAIKEKLSDVADKVSEVISWIIDNWDTISLLGSILLAIAAAIAVTSTVMGILNAVMLASPVTWIVLGIAALVAAFVLLWNKCDAFREFWQNLWAGIKEVFAKLAEDLKPLWEAITGAFKEAWELIKAVWDKVKPFFETIWNNIKITFGAAKDVLGGYFKAAWENIKIVWDIAVSYFTTLWDSIKLIFSAVRKVLSGDFKGAWEDIKKVFSNWGSFFSGLWDKIKQIFKNIGQAIGNAISSTVKGAVNAVLNTATGIINGFIRAINIAIDIINAIPGVNIKKLNLLDVPKMERGGVLKKGQIGLLEGNGAEAVVPLEKNTEWINKVAAQLGDALGAGNGDIVLQVDGNTFGRIAKRSINKHTLQTGKLDLVLA